MSDKILKALEWLELEWDLDVIYQRERINIHHQTIQQLSEREAVYPCFCSKEELLKNRINFKYNGHCRNLPEDQVRKNKSIDKPYCLRFRVPEGYTSWEDIVHGNITVQNDEIEDFIILRTDKTPTYQLAVVADDHEMNISQIIRGDDHISNTPKQILLYMALEWDTPEFAHVPLILGPDKKRLSKRHGATSVEEYRDRGVLADALFNYLSLLGWKPKSEEEMFDKEKIIQDFSLKNISKTSAVFDEKKMAWFNQKYLINSQSEELYTRVLNIWEQANLISGSISSSKKKWVLQIIELLKNRAVYLTDFIDLAEYFFKKPESYEPKGIHQYLNNQKTWKLLKKSKNVLNDIQNFGEEEIEKKIRELAEDQNVSAGKIIHALRLAVTGRTASPGIFKILALLGKNEVLQRLEILINRQYELEATENN
jgi:glutamyl-tRNA synthetase